MSIKQQLESIVPVEELRENTIDEALASRHANILGNFVQMLASEPSPPPVAFLNVLSGAAELLQHGDAAPDNWTEYAIGAAVLSSTGFRSDMPSPHESRPLPADSLSAT